jgi:hypothetical protein
LSIQQSIWSGDTKKTIPKRTKKLFL